jgi:hypothetical protein
LGRKRDRRENGRIGKGRNRIEERRGRMGKRKGRGEEYNINNNSI